jgi:hypothetical protein
MGKELSFGWRTNSNADGFEQHHGRMTMEVFWSDTEQTWSWMLWSNIGSSPQAIEASPVSLRLSLAEAKQQVLKQASVIERQLMQADKKVTK